jgi:hypothetical protein
MSASASRVKALLRALESPTWLNVCRGQYPLGEGALEMRFDAENRTLFIENQSELDSLPNVLSHKDFSSAKKLSLGPGLFTGLGNLSGLPQLETLAFTSTHKHPTLAGSLPDADYLSLNAKALFQCQRILGGKKFDRLDITQVSKVQEILESLPIVAKRLVLSGVSDTVPTVAAPKDATSMRLDGSRRVSLNLDNIAQYSNLTTLNLTNFSAGITNAKALKELRALENISLNFFEDLDDYDWISDMQSLRAIHVRGGSDASMAKLGSSPGTRGIRGVAPSTTSKLGNVSSEILIYYWD